MSIKIEGFLSSEIALWTQKFHSENKEWFELSKKLNEYCLGALREFCSNIDTEPKKFSLALFARCLSNFQGVILLIERGLIVEANSIARVCLEGFINLANLAIEKEKFLEEMRKNDLDVNHKLANELFNSADNIDTQTRVLLQKQLDEIKAKKKAKRSTDQLAKNVDVSLIYPIFRKLSRDVHPTLYSINRYINKVSPLQTELTFDPRIAEKEVAATLQQACAILIGSVVALSNIFPKIKQSPDEFLALCDDYSELFSKMSSQKSERAIR